LEGQTSAPLGAGFDLALETFPNPAFLSEDAPALRWARARRSRRGCCQPGNDPRR
jgi:hypothetical protein